MRYRLALAAAAFSGCRRGFTLLELLIVVAIAGIIAGIGTPSYIGWRADSRHAETMAVVGREMAVVRADAKRRGLGVLVILRSGEPVIGVVFEDGLRNRSIALPHGGVLAIEGSEDEIEMGFGGASAVQAPFAPVRFVVTTGSGVWERSSRVTVIPPLGVLGVRRVGT